MIVVLHCSERAPVPVGVTNRLVASSKRIGGMLSRFDTQEIGASKYAITLNDVGGWCGCTTASDAAGPAFAIVLPDLVVVPAVLASSGSHPRRMKAGLLVERDHTCAVGCAEDSATTSAVVSTCEESEDGSAGRRSATGCR